MTYGAGVVLTPRFLPGFAFSADYYNINLKGAISSLVAQTLVDQCYTAGLQSACSFISTTGGRGVVTPGLAITSIEIKPTNFVSIKTQGIEAFTLAMPSGDRKLECRVEARLAAALQPAS